MHSHWGELVLLFFAFTFPRFSMVVTFQDQKANKTGSQSYLPFCFLALLHASLSLLNFVLFSQSIAESVYSLCSNQVLQYLKKYVYKASCTLLRLPSEFSPYFYSQAFLTRVCCFTLSSIPSVWIQPILPGVWLFRLNIQLSAGWPPFLHPNEAKFISCSLNIHIFIESGVIQTKISALLEIIFQKSGLPSPGKLIGTLTMSASQCPLFSLRNLPQVFLSYAHMYSWIHMQQPLCKS